jgi:MFS family permease
MTTFADSLPRLRGLWRHADFLRLWGAQTVSVFGDQVTLLALPLAAVLVLDASPAQMGLLTAAGWLPHLLFSLAAGVWVDERQRPRALLVAADAARALILLSIPIAYAFDALTMAQLYAATFLVGAGTVVFDLTYTTYFPLIVPRRHILEAQSKFMTTRSASYMGGPPLAGFLVQLLSAPVAILADALSFLGSAALLLRVRNPTPERTEHRERDPLRTRLAGGFRFLFGQPILRASLGCATTLNFFTFAVQAVLVLFLSRELGLSPGVIGAVFAGGALGGLLGAVTAARVGSRMGYGPTVIVGSVLFPAPIALFALATGPEPVVIATCVAAEFLSGLGVMFFDVNLNSIQVLLTPQRLRARTSGVHRTINYGIRPVGAVLGGIAGSAFGLRETLIASAIGATLSVFFVWFSPLRTLHEAPEEAE